MSQNFSATSFKLFTLSLLLGVFHVTFTPSIAEAAPDFTPSKKAVSTKSGYHTEINKNLSKPDAILTKLSHSSEAGQVVEKLVEKRKYYSSRLPEPTNYAERNARADRIMERLRERRLKTSQATTVIPKSAKEFSTAKKATIAKPIDNLNIRPSVTTPQNVSSGRFIYTDKQRSNLQNIDDSFPNSQPPKVEAYTKLESSPFELQKPADKARNITPTDSLTTPPFTFDKNFTEVTQDNTPTFEPLESFTSFEPLESYEAPLPTSVAISQPALLPTNLGLSEETQEILYSLPEKITGLPPKREKSGRFAIKRELSAQAALQSSTPSTDSDSMNISVQKRMAINYDRVLEQAFEAISAGDTQAASALYKDVLTAEPHNVEARFGLATTYHRLGMLEKARNEYGYLLHKQPDHLEGLNNFLALVGEESPVEAVKYLTQLAERNPDYSPLWAQVSSIYQQQGDITSAVEAMERARVVSPENIVYSFNLAVLYDELGDASKASAFYRTILLAAERGQPIPVEIADVQNRLTYLSSL